jgi:hypothetical protein
MRLEAVRRSAGRGTLVAPRRIHDGVMSRRSADNGATDPILVVAAVAVSLALLVGGAFTTSSTVSASKRSAAASSLLPVRVAEEAARLRTGSYTADRSALDGISSFADDGVITANGNCFAAFTSDHSGGYQYLHSGRSTATAVPSPWPTAAPASYPSDCFWPSRASALTPSRVTNLIKNPTAAAPIDGTPDAGQTFNATLAAVPASTTSGTGFQVTPNGSSYDNALTFGDQAANTMRLGMQAGHTYTVSGTILIPTAQARPLDTRSRSIAVFSTDSIFYSQVSPQAPNKPGAYRLTVTFTLPAAATNAFIRFYNGSDSPGDPVVWSNLSLTESAAPYDYGDGSSPGWSWSGAPNQSTSSGPAIGG